MKFIPIATPKISSGDDVADILISQTDFEDNDIVTVSSKVLAMSEGSAIELESITASQEAQEWTDKLARENDDPKFRQAILNETKRMNGNIVSTCPLAMLTELRPDGLEEGVILAVNAGLDKSNIEKGYAIGWPKDCIKSVANLQKTLQEKTGKRLAVIMTDSCCRPRRIGVVAMALTVAGIDPLHSSIGGTDLFGRELLMTQEATADQLATATNILMGNADQSTPAVIVRDHNIPLSDFVGWVPGIDPNEDLFKGLF